MTEDITQELFHNCAAVAYAEVANLTGQNPPDSELVRQRAYQLYEEVLAAERMPCRHPGPRAFTTFSPLPQEAFREVMGYDAPKNYSGQIVSVCCCDCGEVTARKPWPRRKVDNP